MDKTERFDMKKPLRRQSHFLRPVAWALAFPMIWARGVKIDNVNTEGLKPPYLLLCNHNAFNDFKVTTAATFPHRANYVVAIDGFIRREWLLRNVGCICKRKFTSDVLLVRQLQRVVKNGDVAVIYPEARYSLCGTTAVLPGSLGRLAKLMNVPLVTLIIHGNHINSPFWNLENRKVSGIEATMTQLFTAEELKEATTDEVNSAIKEAFRYDEYKWQRERGIRIYFNKRAEGLHKVLYQCPACGAEYRMNSKGTKLICEACGKTWTLSELSELSGDDGITEFEHIPDWYEWERENVRKEIEAGTYRFESKVTVDSLPNAKGFQHLGEGTLTHDMDGFHLAADDGSYSMERPVKSMYSCHIEYDYLGKHGDCIDLNTLDDTYYIYPKGSDFSVTKIALATEELYYQGIPLKER
ncbi:MAG: hypothetical protein EOM54_07005 [Clostridia bacterium]|nr:hypothetical protein [Clostridia bacterium]